MASPQETQKPSPRHYALPRRSFMQLMAGTSAAALLAACAPATAPQSGGGEASPGEAPVEVTFDMYNFDPWLVALDAMFAAFKEENPNINAVVQAAPDAEFWQRQEARLAAGNPADLSIGDPGYFGRYAHKGYYLDLASYIEKDQINLEDWFEVTVNDCRYDSATGIVGQGVLYGMPATYVGTVLYFNKDLLDAAGQPYPDDTIDRLDLLELAKVLTLDANGNNAASADFDPENITQYGITMINRDGISTTVWNNGGELINAEQTESRLLEPQTVEIFEWLAGLQHVEHVHPTPAQLEGVPNPFLVGRVAMSLDGTWNLDYYAENLEFNWDIAPVPLGTVGLDRVTYAGTNTLHIFKDSKNIDAGWELLKYMVGPGGMSYFAKTGTPSHIETANSDVYLQGEPEHRQIAVTLGEYARNYYPGLKSDLWKQIFNAELEALWLGESDAQTVLQSIHDQITPILATPVDEL